MARRLCQYCTRPLNRWAKILHIYACSDCAWRMSMGGTPQQPPTPATPAAGPVCRTDCDDIPGYCTSGWGCLGQPTPSTPEESTRG